MWLVFLIALVLPRSAAAALMTHLDVDSAAFESDAVVAVTKVSERKVNEYATATTVRVVKSYAGAELKVGSTFEIDYSLYSFRPMWGYSTGERVPELGAEMIMFLARPKKEHYRPAPPPDAWFLVSSGMRIFLDGRVQRFVQMNNPGGFEPEPGEMPRGSKVPYDRAGFDVELARAIRRAMEVRTLLDQPRSTERSRRLVELAADPFGARGFGEDSLGAAIVVALSEAQELDAMLSARAVAPRVRSFGLRHTTPTETLVEAALHGSTLERRRAALAMLEGMWFELARKPALGGKLALLLSDPDVSIRKGAISLSFTDDKTPRAYSDAVVARFAVEPDPFVRMMLYDRAKMLKRTGDLRTVGIAIPLAAAAVADDPSDDPALRVAWTGEDIAPDVGNASSIVVVLRDGDRIVRREELVSRRTSASTSTDRGSVTVPLVFAPPLEAKTYDVSVELVVRLGRNDEKLFERRLPVGPVRIVVRDWAKDAGARRSEASSERGPSADVAAPGAVIPPSPSPASSGASPEGRLRALAPRLAYAGVAAAALAAAVLLARRKAKSHRG